MLEACINGGWALRFDGRELVRHTQDAPFAVAVRQEKEYKSSRGTVKLTVREAERIPLTDAAQSGDGVVFSAAGHTLRVEYLPLPGGAELRFSGEAGWGYEFSLPAVGGEAVFGGGEQYRKVNLRGETVVNFVSEHIKASTIVEKALLPAALYREKSHSEIGSYAPMPVFVTDGGRFIAFDADSDGRAVFGEEAYVFAFDSCPRSLRIQTGGSYEELAGFTAANVPNRQYIPEWCMDGMILGVQGGTQTVLDKTFAMLDAGAKICGVWSQDWSGENRTVMGKQVWWNWEADEKLYPDLRGAIEKLRARGVRFLAYINPYLVKGSRLYEQCAAAGYLIRRQDGSIYHIKSTTFDAGMLDLTNPEAVRFTKDVLIKQNMLDLGVSGWMADFGEYLPADCVCFGGSGLEMHNKWPMLWAKCNREAVEEAGLLGDCVFFMRAGAAGSQKYSTLLWAGDQCVDWSEDDGLPSVITSALTAGMSGFGLHTCDAGGYTTLFGLHRDEELLLRWLEFTCFSPVMRTHEGNRPDDNIQLYSSREIINRAARLSHIHTALLPYLKVCVEENAEQGIPVMRPLFYDAPHCERAYDRELYSYLLGDELLAAPVVAPGETQRSLWLPEGEWVHLWSGREYSAGNVSVPAPMGEPPVFYKKNGRFAELFRTIPEIS